MNSHMLPQFVICDCDRGLFDNKILAFQTSQQRVIPFSIMLMHVYGMHEFSDKRAQQMALRPDRGLLSVSLAALKSLLQWRVLCARGSALFTFEQGGEK